MVFGYGMMGGSLTLFAILLGLVDLCFGLWDSVVVRFDSVWNIFKMAVCHVISVSGNSYP
ncbi:hypothetical protein ERO13_1Z049303v2 [Gossypium hirsutum]|nr:hypothetical protein ERO13_1Z049303v2 [Gossypium hirsutum]